MAERGLPKAAQHKPGVRLRTDPFLVQNPLPPRERIGATESGLPPTDMPAGPRQLDIGCHVQYRSTTQP